VEYVKVASLNMYEESRKPEGRILVLKRNGPLKCAKEVIVLTMSFAVENLINERRNFCEILQT
jgi:hypothetical protein